MVQKLSKINRTNVASSPQTDFFTKKLNEKIEPELYDGVISPFLELKDFELDGLLSDNALFRLWLLVSSSWSLLVKIG